MIPGFCGVEDANRAISGAKMCIDPPASGERPSAFHCL